VNRDQLAHVLRAVARIAGDSDILVIGSQSILGSYPEDALPPQATGSMEVDTAFLTDPRRERGRGAGCAWNRTTASWLSSSGSTRRT
jgi:hypothetical protein